jgi:hypothetical protein
MAIGEPRRLATPLAADHGDGQQVITLTELE